MIILKLFWRMECSLKQEYGLIIFQGIYLKNLRLIHLVM